MVTVTPEGRPLPELLEAVAVAVLVAVLVVVMKIVPVLELATLAVQLPMLLLVLVLVLETPPAELLAPQEPFECLSKVSSSPIDPSSPWTNCHVSAEQLWTVSLLNP